MAHSYDFDRLKNRQQTDSRKWDVAEGELSMTVADMDFEVAPEIRTALARRMEQGIFGYDLVPEAFGQAFASWWRERHQVELNPDWVIYATGVIPAIASVVRHLTVETDGIVVMAPVYNGFYNTLRSLNRQLVESPLLYADGAYDIDFDDLEAKLADPVNKMLIFCNPHNPIGKNWDLETVERIAQLCHKYGVYLLSDEIHCDLAHEGSAYQPILRVDATLLDRVLIFLSPTKTFNIAGLHASAVVVPSAALRTQVAEGVAVDNLGHPNNFSVVATVAAFEKGQSWLDALRTYLLSNKKYLEDFIRSELPQLTVVPADATYLAWIDISQVEADSQAFTNYVRQKSGLVLAPGHMYGEAGRSFIRLNYACPRTRLEDALQRLKLALSED